MNSRDNKDLNGLIRIRQIINRVKKKNGYHPDNKNFEEFKQVYSGVLFQNSGANMPETYLSVNSLTASRSGGHRRTTPRPSSQIKTIRIELPLVGCEDAIIIPKKPKILPKKAPKKKNVETKDKEILTQELLDRWDKMEDKPGKKGKEIDNSPSLLLERTNRDIDQAAAQLEKIKSMITAHKQPEKIRRRAASPTYNPRRKPDRHHDCISRKYLSTLTTMKQKLDRLEDKYFNKPQVIYKSVRDIHIQPSNVEILYECNKFPEDTKLDEALIGIKQGLDNIAGASVVDEKQKNGPSKERTDIGYIENMSSTPPFLGDYTESKLNKYRSRKDEFMEMKAINEERIKDNSRNLSFKKPTYSDCLGSTHIEPISKIIDFSESKFKKYRNVKQDLMDVEAFCEELCKIGKGDIDSEDPKPVKDYKMVHKENPDIIGDNRIGIFDDTELQKSVSKSNYLMKEFNIKPNVKVFSESQSLLRRNRFIEPSEIKSNPCQSSIVNLIENLNLALKNSIYKPAES